jgi:hypothetical protein
MTAVVTLGECLIALVAILHAATDPRAEDTHR